LHRRYPGHHCFWYICPPRSDSIIYITKGNKDIFTEIGKKFEFLKYLKNISLRIPYFPELRVDDTFTYIRNTYKEKYSEYLEGLLMEMRNILQRKTMVSHRSNSQVCILDISFS
jgi:hypothetical protein